MLNTAVSLAHNSAVRVTKHVGVSAKLISITIKGSARVFAVHLQVFLLQYILKISACTGSNGLIVDQKSYVLRIYKIRDVIKKFSARSCSVRFIELLSMSFCYLI